MLLSNKKQNQNSYQSLYLIWKTKSLKNVYNIMWNCFSWNLLKKISIKKLVT